MGKRFTPEEDVDRLAERVFRDSGQSIEDEEMFNLAFDSYLGEVELNKLQNTTLRKKVFDSMRASHPEIMKGSLFKKAGGKSFKRDRAKTAREVVTDIKIFKKKGAGKVDLQGYDTKKGGVVRTKHKFDIPGSVKEKIVFARRTVVLVNNQEQVRFRDKLGRFTSVKRRR